MIKRNNKSHSPTEDLGPSPRHRRRPRAALCRVRGHFHVRPSGDFFRLRLSLAPTCPGPLQLHSTAHGRSRPSVKDALKARGGRGRSGEYAVARAGRRDRRVGRPRAVFLTATRAIGRSSSVTFSSGHEHAKVR